MMSTEIRSLGRRKLILLVHLWISETKDENFFRDFCNLRKNIKVKQFYLYE